MTTLDETLALYSEAIAHIGHAWESAPYPEDRGPVAPMLAELQTKIGAAPDKDAKLSASKEALATVAAWLAEANEDVANDVSSIAGEQYADLLIDDPDGSAFGKLVSEAVMRALESRKIPAHA